LDCGQASPDVIAAQPPCVRFVVHLVPDADQPASTWSAEQHIKVVADGGRGQVDPADNPQHSPLGQPAGRLYDKFGTRWPAIIGLLLTGSGLLLLSRIDIDISRSELVVGMVVMAAGLGLGFMPIMTGGLAVLAPDLRPGHELRPTWAMSWSPRHRYPRDEHLGPRSRPARTP